MDGPNPDAIAPNNINVDAVGPQKPAEVEEINPAVLSSIEDFREQGVSAQENKGRVHESGLPAVDQSLVGDPLGLNKPLTETGGDIGGQAAETAPLPDGASLSGEGTGTSQSADVETPDANKGVPGPEEMEKQAQDQNMGEDKQNANQEGPPGKAPPGNDVIPDIPPGDSKGEEGQSVEAAEGNPVIYLPLILKDFVSQASEKMGEEGFDSVRFTFDFLNQRRAEDAEKKTILSNKYAFPLMCGAFATIAGALYLQKKFRRRGTKTTEKISSVSDAVVTGGAEQQPETPTAS